MSPEAFMTNLAGVKLREVFNPYSETCTVHDLPESPHYRRDNLTAALRIAWQTQGGSIWIARDLGYRGGRRTGLPLTDEMHLAHFSHTWGGLPLKKATAGPPVAERTAAIVWRMLQRIGQPIFLWNIFPLHPYAAGNSLSNRAHTREERKVGLVFLLELLEVLKPTRIVAIGGDASSTLQHLGLLHLKVRHPSYGGQSEFCDGIRKAYSLGYEDPCMPTWLPK